MQIHRLLDFLALNVDDSDRELFENLEKHISKKDNRSLSIIIEKYNIRKEDFFFPIPTSITEEYTTRLEKLVKLCDYIVNKKIDISSFDYSSVSVGMLLDISSVEKIDKIYNMLLEFDDIAPNILISDELLNNPLAIITSRVCRNIEMQLFEKPIFDYCNSHIYEKDECKKVRKEESIVEKHKKLTLIDKSKKFSVSKTVYKDAVFNYFKETGKYYYLPEGFEDEMTPIMNVQMEHRIQIIVNKTNLYYKGVEFVLPIVNLILSFILLVMHIAQMGNPLTNGLTLLLSLINAVGMVSYVRRAKIILNDKDSYCHLYYQSFPRYLHVILPIYLGTAFVQLINLIIYSVFFKFATNAIGELIGLMYDNKAMLVIVTIIIFAITIFGIVNAYRNFRNRFNIALMILAGGFLVLNFGIRINFMNMLAFRDVSILFIIAGISILFIIILEYPYSRWKYFIMLGIFILDLILVFAFNDMAYLIF